jgi:hypothetical protein
MKKAQFSPSSWILRDFPDLDPAAVLRHPDGASTPVNRTEYERALWLWQRRPREIAIWKYLIALAFVGLLHAPFGILADPSIFFTFHLCYVVVVALVGLYVIQREARFRKWRRDYLRCLSRLIGS